VNSKVGGTIALTLLLLYVYVYGIACCTVHCTLNTGCTAYTAANFSATMAGYLATLNGLVSALVVAELYVTHPGELPAGKTDVAGAAGGGKGRAYKVITWAYMLVWFLSGLWAFWIAIHHPTALQPLTTLGQSWFGIAIIAGYSYFGVKP